MVKYYSKKRKNIKTIDFQGFVFKNIEASNYFDREYEIVINFMWNDVFTGGKSTESLIYPMVKTIV